jgi:O-antigen/teichoic acid export membrane protein
VLSISLFVFAGDLIGFVFGPGFDAGVLVLQILAFPALLRLVNNSMVVHLQATHRQGDVVRCLLHSVVTLICVALLIPWYGIVGAACARIAADLHYSVGLLRALGSDRTIVLSRLPVGICLVASGVFVTVHKYLDTTVPWVADALISATSAVLVIVVMDAQARALLRTLWNRVPIKGPNQLGQ